MASGFRIVSGYRTAARAKCAKAGSGGRGTPLAVGADMSNDPFVALLTDLHRSLDRLAEDLAADRPALAEALRRESAWIPRPDELMATPPPSAAEACASLPPLLYQALDAGVVDARRFDALMVRGRRAARCLAGRRS
jgi:hypothetical protein